jgi:hypothetical protein
MTTSPMTRLRGSVLLACATVVVLAVSACGGSSKPGYCSDRSNLEQAIKDVGNVKVAQSGGLSQLKSQLQKVETSANTLVSSAKSDFPTETGALSSSVSKLKSDVQGLPSSPSPQQLAATAADAKSVVTSFQNLKKATDSKC